MIRKRNLAKYLLNTISVKDVKKILTFHKKKYLEFCKIIYHYINLGCYLKSDPF